MPTPPTTDIARRLQEISTLLNMIKAMKTEPRRAGAIDHLWLAVEDLCDVPDDDHHQRSMLVRKLFLLIKKLRSLADGDSTWDDDIATLLQVIAFISEPPAKALALQMPTYTNLKGESIMANFALPLDKIATFTITEANPTTGAFDPVDPADVFTITSVDPTNLNAVAGTNAAGGAALVVNWLHTVDPNLTGVQVTVADSQGNVTFTQMFDMVPAARVPDQLGLDIANVVMADQPVPV